MRISVAVDKFLRSQEGATAIEYALIAAIVSISIVVGLTGVTNQLESIFTQVSSGFQAATN